MKNQKGFTLVELVVVIVILGILSAVAVPKFISMETDARKASLNGLKGALSSGNALVHSLAIVEGKTAASGESVTVEGSTVGLAYGYPTVAGIKAAVSGAATDFSESSGVYTITGYSGSDCKVTYAAATGASTPSSVTIVTSGC